MSIYGKAMEIADLQNKIEESVDLETGEIDEELLLALTTAGDEFNGKAVALRNWTCDLDSDVEGISAEIKRLTAIKKAKENLSKRIKKSVVEAMRAVGLDKIETPTMKISYTETEETIIDDEAMIPAEYMIAQKPKPDKTAIKAAIKRGEAIGGARLQTNYNLRVR